MHSLTCLFKLVFYQVTSYGGTLRYTVTHVPGFDSSPNSDADVEIQVRY